MPAPLRSIVALVGGFAIMTFLWLALTFAAVATLGIGPAAGGWPLTANLLTFAVAAFAGGYSTAALAPRLPLPHAVGVAAMMLVMALSSLRHPAAGLPAWHPVALAVIGPVCALAGGLLWLRRVGASKEHE